MGLFTSAQLFNAGRNSRQTHSQFLVYGKKWLTFLIFDVGQLIFRDSKAGMVPSTLGMCRYIWHSEIVCRGPKKFEYPCSNRSEILCIQRFVITVVATFDLHIAYLCVVLYFLSAKRNHCSVEFP